MNQTDHNRTLTILPTANAEREWIMGRARTEPVFGHSAVSRMKFIKLIQESVNPEKMWLGEGESLAVLAGAVSAYYASHPAAPYAGLRHRAGFWKSLQHFLNECRLARIAEGELAAILKAGGCDDARAILLNDLYDAHGRKLHESNATTAATAESALAEALRRSFRSVPLFEDIDEIEIRGIYDIKPASFEWILELARHKPTTLYLPLPKDHPRSIRWLEWTYRKFEYLGDEAPEGLTLQSEDLQTGRAMSELLPRLFQPLAKLRQEQIPPLASGVPLRILESDDPLTEITEIARLVRARLDEGTDARKIAVLIRRPEHYPNAMDAFGSFGIPVEVSAELQSEWNPDPAAREVLELAALASNGFKREEMIGWLGRTMCELPAALEDPDLGRILREAKVMEGSVRAMQERLDHYAGAHKKDGARCFEISKSLKELFGKAESLTKSASPEKYMRRLQEALTEIGFFDRISGEGSGRIYRKLATLIKTMDGWDEELEPDILFSLAEVALQGEPARSAEGVRILSVEDLIGLEVDHLFIAGMISGAFPKEPKQEVFLKDWERSEISAAFTKNHREMLGHRLAGHRPFDTAREERLRENFLFFLCLSQASKTVTLSYPRLDTDGRPSSPSPYIDEIFKQFENPEQLRAMPDIGRGRPRTKVERETEAIRALSAGEIRVEVSDADRLRRLVDQADIERRREMFFLERDREIRAKLAFEFTGRLAGDGPFWTKEEISVGALDMLAGCPFKGFSGALLGIREIDQPSEGLSPKDMGTLMHKFLELLWKELLLRCNPAEESAEKIIQSARTLAPGILAAAAGELAKAGAEGALWNSQKSALKHLIDSILDMEEQAVRSGFWPVKLEEAVSLEVNAGGARLPRKLKGRIDRLDRGLDGSFRVVDYKLSDVGTLRQKKKKLGRTEFQLPVYAKASLPAGLSPQTPVQLLYVSLRHAARVVEAWSGPVEETEELLRLESIFDGLAAGRFDVTPADETLCATCDFRKACRIQQVLSAESDDSEEA